MLTAPFKMTLYRITLKGGFIFKLNFSFIANSVCYWILIFLSCSSVFCSFDELVFVFIFPYTILKFF